MRLSDRLGRVHLEKPSWSKTKGEVETHSVWSKRSASGRYSSIAQFHYLQCCLGSGKRSHYIALCDLHMHSSSFVVSQLCNVCFKHKLSLSNIQALIFCSQYRLRQVLNKLSFSLCTLDYVFCMSLQPLRHSTSLS